MSDYCKNVSFYVFLCFFLDFLANLLLPPDKSFMLQLLWKNGDKSGGSEQLIEPLLAALSSSSMLSLPPSRRAAAMPCTATFLAPRAGDFNCKFLFETSMELPTLCYWERSKWNRMSQPLYNMKVILYLCFSQVYVNLTRNTSSQTYENSSGTEFIDKFQFNKMWDLCLQGVIIVMQAGGINHR